MQKQEKLQWCKDVARSLLKLLKSRQNILRKKMLDKIEPGEIVPI